jgi:hypothetical protein
VILVFGAPDRSQADPVIDLLLACQAEVGSVELVADVRVDEVPDRIYRLIIDNIHGSGKVP